MVTFTLLILLIHGISFRLLIPSLISFFNVWVLIYKFFTCLVSAISRYSLRLLWKVMFPWFFSLCVCHLYFGRLFGFCVLILNAATLLKVFIRCRGLLVISLWWFTHKIISSTNKNTLAYFFPICIPLIIFSCLTALGKILNSILKRYGEVDILVSFMLIMQMLCISLHLEWCCL